MAIASLSVRKLFTLICLHWSSDHPSGEDHPGARAAGLVVKRWKRGSQGHNVLQRLQPSPPHSPFPHTMLHSLHADLVAIPIRLKGGAGGRAFFSCFCLTSRSTFQTRESENAVADSIHPLLLRCVQNNVVQETKASILKLDRSVSVHTHNGRYTMQLT